DLGTPVLIVELVREHAAGAANVEQPPWRRGGRDKACGPRCRQLLLDPSDTTLGFGLLPRQRDHLLECLVIALATPGRPLVSISPLAHSVDDPSTARVARVVQPAVGAAVPRPGVAVVTDADRQLVLVGSIEGEHGLASARSAQHAGLRVHHARFTSSSNAGR